MHQAAPRQVVLVAAVIAHHLHPGEQRRLDVAAEQLMHSERVLQIQVFRVRCDTLAQRAHIGMRSHHVAERKQRGEPLHGRVRRLQALQAFQLLARSIDIAVERLQFRQSGLQVDVLAIAGQLVLDDLARGGEIASCFQLLCALHRAVDGFRQVLVEEVPDLRLGHHADEVIDDRAVLEQHDGRQAPHADLLRQLLLLVGVHLGELEAPARTARPADRGSA